MKLYALLAAVASLAISPMRVSARIDVLLKSGDVAQDGRVLSSFVVSAGSPSKVAFLGGTSAIITKSGGVFSVFAKSGDPLPAPLVGTFNSFDTPVINDAGNMVFRASLNSKNAGSGLFYCCDAGAIVPISLFGGTSGGPISVSRSPDLNNNNEVVFTGNNDIYRWDLATRSSVKVADTGAPSPGGGTFTRFGNRPVLYDNGDIAFEADVTGGPDGIFVVQSPFTAPSTCALEGAASPIAGGTFAGIGPATAVAINDTDGVAFVANAALPGPDPTGVFVCDPYGSSYLVAREGDLVGASTLTTIDDEFVGIDASYNVAFEGTAGTRQLVLGDGFGPLTGLAPIASSSEFAPRLTPSHGIVWRRGASTIERLDGATSTVTSVATSSDTPLGLGTFPREPSINASDVVAFRAFQSALYTLSRGAVVRVAGPGDASPGGGTFSTIDALAYRGGSLAFAATESTGGALIALKKGSGPIQAVVRDDDAAPGGGTFLLGSLLFDVRGGKVLFQSQITGGVASSGIFRVNTASGKLETVVLQGDASPDGGTFNAFLSVVATGNDATFVANTSEGRGVFMKNGSGVITVAHEDDVLPDTGGGLLGSLSSVAASSNRVVFFARVDSGTVPDGLFLWDHGVTRRLVSEGDPAGIPGVTFESLNQGAFDSGGGLPLAISSSIGFAAPVTGGTASDGIFATRNNGSVVPVVLNDEPTPLGGMLTGLEFLLPISRVGSFVVFAPTLTAESGVATAVIRANP